MSSPTLPQVIEFNQVSKVYTLGSGHTSLRSALAGLKDRIFQNERSAEDPQHLYALNNVSFEFSRGESVGIIGPNGSGKTTTLKLISNITQATSGKIRVRGRLSALIELGAGFHPDLTGRENIYFNAAILGMRRLEIQKRFDEIVAFSGLERFLDTPVKRYSSGMYCRLGFAVAAHVNPDILLVDEVLAVGDSTFQAKCLKRMSELRADGTTIVFVTHDLGYLQRLCKRAIFLYRGNTMADGPVSDVIQQYRDHPAYTQGNQPSEEDPLCETTVSAPQDQDQHSGVASPISIQSVSFRDPRTMSSDAIRTGSPLDIIIRYEASQPIDGANFEVWIYGLDGSEYASFATAWDDVGNLRLRNSGEICLHIDPICLMPGTYYVNVAISDLDGLKKYDMHWDRHKISVLSGPVSYGLLYQPHRWITED